MREKITPEEAMAEYIGCECDTLRKRVEELERERDEARAEALRILRLCADRPNLDHIPFQPARLEDWFNRMDNAGKGGA